MQSGLFTLSSSHTFTVQDDLDVHAGLHLRVLLLSHHEVLQVLALRPAQRAGVVHVQQSPHLAGGLGNAHGSVAGLRFSRHVPIGHVQPVRDVEAAKLLAVVDTHLANLQIGCGAKKMSANNTYVDQVIVLILGLSWLT